MVCHGSRFVTDTLCSSVCGGKLVGNPRDYLLLIEEAVQSAEFWEGSHRHQLFHSYLSELINPPSAAVQATTVFPLVFSFTSAFLLFFAVFAQKGFGFGLAISLLIWVLVSVIIVVVWSERFHIFFR